MSQKIQIGLIYPNPDSFRKQLDDEPEGTKLTQTIDGLAQNIAEHGLIHPITVRKIPEQGTYQIVAGERRYLACKSLGHAEIECKVIEPTEDQRIFISLSENLQRKDLSEVEKAEALHELILLTGLTLRPLAQKLGISHVYIKWLLDLHGFPTEVKEMVHSCEVSAKNVRPLSQLDDEREQIKTAEYIKGRELNYKAAQQTVSLVKKMPEPVKEKLRSEPDYSVEDAIKETLNVDVIQPDQVDVYLSGEYFPGEADYNCVKAEIGRVSSLINIPNICNWNPMDRIKIKQELVSLRQTIDDAIIYIDRV